MEIDTSSPRKDVLKNQSSSIPTNDNREQRKAWFQTNPNRCFVLMSVIMALYNQANLFFWSIVLLCIAVMYLFDPKYAFVRDTILLTSSITSVVLPLFLHTTHPGFRLMFACQNVFLVLKIWSYIRHMSSRKYTLQQIFFYFSHPAVVLGEYQPVSLDHINERAKELYPKLGLVCLCFFLRVYPTFISMTILDTLVGGFLFYLIVDCINELLALPLMWMSGFYITRFFDRPYLSASPREFWSKRWNIWIQNFQLRNIFLPVKSLGLPTPIAVFFVCAFAIVMHEYMVYAAHLEFKWSGYMALFFVLHFTMASLEIITKKLIQKSQYKLPSALQNPIIGIAMHTMWLAVTGDLFIHPFFSAWSKKPLYGHHLHPESWSWIEFALYMLIPHY